MILYQIIFLIGYFEQKRDAKQAHSRRLPILHQIIILGKILKIYL